MAERRSFASRAGAAGRPGPGGAAGRPRPGGAAGSVRRTLGLSPRRGAKGGDEEWSGGDEEWNGGDEEWSSGGEAWSGGEAARRPWEAGQPAAAATLLARCLAAGAVTQVTGPEGTAQAGGHQESRNKIKKQLPAVKVWRSRGSGAVPQLSSSLCAPPRSPRVPPAFCRRAFVGAAVPQAPPSG